jgi:hypothetical protein
VNSKIPPTGDTFVNADTLKSSTMAFRAMDIEEVPSQDTFPELNSHIALSRLQEQYRQSLPTPIENVAPQSSNIRRLLLPVLLGFGVVVGMIFANSQSSTEPVAAVDQLASLASNSITAAPTADIIPQQVSLQIDEPIIPALEQYISNSVVPLSSETLQIPVTQPRYYQAEPSLDGLTLSDPGTTFSLSEADRNRYASSTGGPDWQGGWKLKSPEANIRLADSYEKYLQTAKGENLNIFNNLRAVKQPKTSLPGSHSSVQHRIIAE